MNQETNYDKLIKLNKFWLWAGKIAWLFVFLSILAALFAIINFIASQPLSIMEVLESNPKMYLSFLLAMLFSLLPFLLVNSHNLLKIKIDYFLQMKAMLNNNDRQREISDEKITNVVRNSKIIIGAFGGIFAIPFLYLTYSYVQNIVKGIEMLGHMTTLTPIIFISLIFITYLYSISLKKEDDVILSYRESEINKPQKNNNEIKIKEILHSKHITTVSGVFVYTILLFVIYQMSNDIFTRENPIDLFIEFDPVAIAFSMFLLFLITFPYMILKERRSANIEINSLK